MQEHGIAGVKLRRRVKTTVSEPSDQKVGDLFKRDFTAAAPNLKYVGIGHHLRPGQRSLQQARTPMSWASYPS